MFLSSRYAKKMPMTLHPDRKTNRIKLLKNAGKNLPSKTVKTDQEFLKPISFHVPSFSPSHSVNDSAAVLIAGTHTKAMWMSVGTPAKIASAILSPRDSWE